MRPGAAGGRGPHRRIRPPALSRCILFGYIPGSARIRVPTSVYERVGNERLVQQGGSSRARGGWQSERLATSSRSDLRQYLRAFADECREVGGRAVQRLDALVLIQEQALLGCESPKPGAEVKTSKGWRGVCNQDQPRHRRNLRTGPWERVRDQGAAVRARLRAAGWCPLAQLGRRAQAQRKPPQRRQERRPKRRPPPATRRTGRLSSRGLEHIVASGSRCTGRRAPRARQPWILRQDKRSRERQRRSREQLFCSAPARTDGDPE